MNLISEIAEFYDVSRAIIRSARENSNPVNYVRKARGRRVYNPYQAYRQGLFRPRPTLMRRRPGVSRGRARRSSFVRSYQPAVKY